MKLIEGAQHFIYIGMLVFSDMVWFVDGYFLYRESVLVSPLLNHLNRQVIFVRFSISATKAGEQVKNQIAKALVERIVRAAQEGTNFKVRSSYIPRR